MTGHVHVLPAGRLETQSVQHLLRAASIDARLGLDHTDDTVCAGVVALCLHGEDFSRVVVHAREQLGDVPVTVVAEPGDKVAHQLVGPWDNARVISARCSSDQLVEAVTGMITGARVSRRTVPDRVQPDASVLTGRESEIAQLVAAGWRNREIAEHLGISPHTVRTHTQRLLMKLDVQHRLALAAKLPATSAVPRPRRSSDSPSPRALSAVTGRGAP